MAIMPPPYVVLRLRLKRIWPRSITTLGVKSLYSKRLSIVDCAPSTRFAIVSSTPCCRKQKKLEQFLPAVTSCEPSSNQRSVYVSRVRAQRILSLLSAEPLLNRRGLPCQSSCGTWNL